MHDIDRVLFEMEQTEAPASYELAGGQQESLEADLAGRLLEVSSEQELDHFLGSLLSRAASAFGLGNLDAGRALGGLLKSAGKQVLPRLGQALGGHVSPSGGQIGSTIGSFVGSQLGLELEGLSQEDREYEVSRAFVRFANEAAEQAIASPPTVPPPQAALEAATSAAQRQLPGLLPLIQQLTPPEPSVPGGHRGFPRSVAGARQSGRWVRRGTRIVLMDV
jgi:hypothetical protein